MRSTKLFRAVKRRKPSPAIIISIIALVFAAGGGYAIAKKKSSPKKIANNVVTKRAPGLSVLHAQTADNATNANSANSANTANNVGGMKVVKIYAELAEGTGTTTIASANGFTVTASCGAADEVTADVHTPTVANTLAEAQGNNDNTGPFTNEDESSSVSSSDVELTGTPGTANDGGSTFTAAVKGGANLSGQIEFKPGSETYNTDVCVYSGFAFAG